MSHPSPVARFYVGQIVHHLRFDYRGVVFDVDPTFQGTDDWYEAVARSRPPKDRHPLVGVLCGDYRDGRYLPRGEVQ